MKRVEKVMVILVMAAAAVVLVTGFSNAAGGHGPPVCPQIYAPVICDGDRIFPNQCYADRAHARNCVPYNNDL